MLLLRHVGRKTGQPRPPRCSTCRDGDNYAVIASKGGDPKHPGWFHNLTANPDVEIQIGRKRIPVRARVAEGDERACIWARANEVNKGGYDVYQTRTDRKIPVVVLEDALTEGKGATGLEWSPTAPRARPHRCRPRAWQYGDRVVAQYDDGEDLDPRAEARKDELDP